MCKDSLWRISYNERSASVESSGNSVHLLDSCLARPSTPLSVDFLLLVKFSRCQQARNILLLRERFVPISKSFLRTVPNKYKGFCARYGPRGKSRSLQGLLESTNKIGVVPHIFEIISLESQQKCRHQHLSEKEVKDVLLVNFSYLNCNYCKAILG